MGGREWDAAAAVAAAVVVVVRTRFLSLLSLLSLSSLSSLSPLSPLSLSPFFVASHSWLLTRAIAPSAGMIFAGA